MIPRVKLATFDDAVIPPPGVFYSTNPHRAEGENGVPYFVKNTELETVFAEVAGSRLAQEVGLPVAGIAACVWDDGLYAGSVKVPKAIRHIDPWINRSLKVVNFHDLFNVIVVDTWLANNDRNIESVVGKPIQGDTIEFVFIDFEKSVTLHPNPVILSPMVEPNDLWPRGKLGMELRACKPLVPPVAIINRIRDVTRPRCEEIIGEVLEAINLPVAWADGSAQALAHRAQIIPRLAEDVWAT
jgi:hypothetical protein